MKTSQRSDAIVKAAMQAACDVFGRPMSDMTSRSRRQHIVWPRQCAMAIALAKSGLSEDELCKRFKKSHGAVHHAAKTVKDRVSTGNRSEDYGVVMFLFEHLISDEVDQALVGSTG